MNQDIKKTNKKKSRQSFVGQVVGAKMNKTIKVSVYHLKKEKKYGRYVKQLAVFKAHDEKNRAQEGDKVRIFETRPISKTKKWVLGQILEKKETQG